MRVDENIFPYAYLKVNSIHQVGIKKHIAVHIAFHGKGLKKIFFGEMWHEKYLKK